MTSRPWFWTVAGGLCGIAAAVAWIATFNPHGGPELSWLLFPVTRWVLNALYPTESIPVALWYGGAVLHWLLPGICVDGIRWWRRRKRSG